MAPLVLPFTHRTLTGPGTATMRPPPRARLGPIARVLRVQHGPFGRAHHFSMTYGLVDLSPWWAGERMVSGSDPVPRRHRLSFTLGYGTKRDFDPGLGVLGAPSLLGFVSA